MKARNRPGSGRPAPSKQIEKPQSERAPPKPRPQNRFPIVGVGASAGGLEAFTRLLQNLPPDTGMAFVLVQHLDPAHPSALTQLLSKATTLPLHEVTKDQKIEPNQIYVIAPNTNLGMGEGTLKLSPRPEGRGVHRSIDFFFEALARDQGDCAIGVVLSGTASDGTLGLEAIKGEGGITFAQDTSASYRSMPESAIAAGCVDFVLSPENIAKELARIARHPFLARGVRTEPAACELGAGPRLPEQVVEDDVWFKKILVLLRNHSAVDFSLYKSSTIQRRITRRMVLNKVTTFEEYARHLRGDGTELSALYADVLISVTTFFRNPEAFEFLKRKVFPKLFPEARDEPVRVWALACSTGQEVYSLVIALTEFFDGPRRPPKLQIFASDLNEAALNKARVGLYPKSVVQDVSPERLRRFFSEEEGGYRVIKPLREVVVFARQNLLSDPPFSRMDLVSCRNLLIYLEGSVQKAAIPIFHYALKPGGCLLLGASETVGSFTNLFEQMDKKHKIYIKKSGLSPALHLHRTPKAVDAGKPVNVAKPAETRDEPYAQFSAQREADRVTRKRYAPPGVVVNSEFQALEFRGQTSPYLEPPMGQANFNVLKMAREGLMLPLRAALNKARKTNKVVRRENVRVQQNGEGRPVTFEVIPLRNLKEQYYLIFFEETPAKGTLGASGKAAPSKITARQESSRMKELEMELAETRDYLQSVEEQHEIANEEVQASNEEATSANEELQSINEELETSKEELESANEELTTVNEEMANRNVELNRVNNDLTNLQTSTHLAIVLLGPDLTIRRFSVEAGKQFNLLATDVGRPITNVRHDLVFEEEDAEAATAPFAPKGETAPAAAGKRGAATRKRRGSGKAIAAGCEGPLEKLIRNVIASGREHECEARDNAGRWFSLRLRPYIGHDHKVDGAVLVLVSIDALKESARQVSEAREISEAREFAESTVETVRESLLVLDSDLHIKSANRSFYRTFQMEPAETIGKHIFDLGNRQWDIPKLREALENILPQNSRFENFEVEQEFKRVGRRTMLLNARRIYGTMRKSQLILLAIDDVTEQVRREQELQSSYVAAAIVHTARDPLVILDGGLRIHSASEAFYKTFALSPAQTEGRSLFELGEGQWDNAHLRRLLQEVLSLNSFFNDLEITLDLKPGGHRTFLFDGRMLKDHKDKILLSIQDITEVLTFQAALRHTEVRYRRLFEAAQDGVLIVDPENGKILDANPFMTVLLGYTHDEILGKELFEVGLLKDVETKREMFRKLATHAVVRHDCLSITGQEGAERFAEMVSNLYQENGDKVIQCNIRDVTQRMRAEVALRQAQEQLANRASQLEQAVAEQTAELTASNRQLEAFVYTVAHDLRAPLRAMQGFSGLLVEEAGASLSETSRDYAARINRSALFMDALLGDLLAFSRIGLQAIELRSVKLETTLRAVLLRLENEIQEKKGSVELNGPWPDVLAYEPILGQVFLNLIMNALKFMRPDAPPHVRVRAEAAGEMARIWVEDNGIGIAASYQEQIFRPFMRLNGESYGGTGIGLAIVQKGIERMGGRVGVESTVGEGSRFWFELPKA